MSAPEQLVPTLTIIEDEGDFTVRVGGQDNAKQISQAVIPLLSGLGARKLLLITPYETKVFRFGNGKSNGNGTAAVASPAQAPARRTVVADEGAPPTEEDATAEFERFLEAEKAEAERVTREMAVANQADPDLSIVEPEAAPAPVKRGRPPKDKVENVSTCGRCFGQGSNEAGGTCPVCRGKGSISKWGRRR